MTKKMPHKTHKAYSTINMMTMKKMIVIVSIMMSKTDTMMQQFFMNHLLWK